MRVHPFFWVLSLLLGINVTQGELKLVLVWLATVFLSILAHELGHALTARHYGYRPWITLHQFGGLASYNGERLESRKKIMVSFAGPAAGFLIAILITAILFATGHVARLSFSFAPVRFYPYMPLVEMASGLQPAPLDALIDYMLQVNIFWGLINLFPVLPLDGGQIAREYLIEKDPYGGMRKSLILSVGAAVVLVVFALANQDLFLVLMFGYLGYSSYRILQENSGGGRSW